MRFSRLPTMPDLKPLRRGKRCTFCWDHEHHLLEEDLCRVVLHRPIEPAPFHSTRPLLGSAWDRVIAFRDGSSYVAGNRANAQLLLGGLA